MRGFAYRGVLLGALVAVVWGASADSRVLASEAGEAVRATIDVERTLLAEDLETYGRISANRGVLLGRIQELYTELGAAMRSEGPGASTTVNDLMARIESVERERTDQLDRERLLVNRLSDRKRRVELLEEELAELEARRSSVTGPIEGRWSVVLMPANQRGEIHFKQTGTVVTGTYTLEGGWTGSLQGTMVERKIHVIRIDSRLGRYMELDGYLSADGRRIRGTWLSYDQSGGSPPHGNWAATRGGVGE